MTSANTTEGMGFILFLGEKMLKYLYIGAGGAVGAILRYAIKEIKIGQNAVRIPADTLFINVFGCFLLAFIFTVALETLAFGSDLRLGLTTGLLGAFTTFSTLCKETAILITQGFYISAVFYVLLSIFLAFFAVYAGTALARWFFTEKNERRKK